MGSVPAPGEVRGAGSGVLAGFCGATGLVGFAGLVPEFRVPNQNPPASTTANAINAGIHFAIPPVFAATCGGGATGGATGGGAFLGAGGGVIGGAGFVRSGISLAIGFVSSSICCSRGGVRASSPCTLLRK